MATLTSSASRPGTRDANTPGSSAAVLEFMCLFTHDLRRKQKRWQDGRLKYHTFNRRVMVYDDRGNFVGDMHWTRDWEFDEGEEVELERGGIIVQVSECVGQQKQDLSELLDKRAKEKEERQAKLASRPIHPAIANSPVMTTPRVRPHQDQFQNRHRPLLSVIGTPTGHHGRAVVPTESPFEQRQHANETPDSGSRPSKRPRYEDTPPSKLGYAQALFGASLTLSGMPMSSAPTRRPVAASNRPRRISSSPHEDGDQDPEPEPAPRHQRKQAKNVGGSKAAANFAALSRPLASHPPAPSLPRHKPAQVRRDANDDTRSDGEVVEVETNQAPRSYGNSSYFAGAGPSDSVSKAREMRKDTTRPLARSIQNPPGKTVQTGPTPARPSPNNEPPSDVIIIDDADEECDQDNRLVADHHTNHTTKASKRTAPEDPNPAPRKAKRKKVSPTTEKLNDTGPIKDPDVPAEAVRPQAEPRTELRLKSRKRGLLVMPEITKKTRRSAGNRSGRTATESFEDGTVTPAARPQVESASKKGVTDGNSRGTPLQIDEDDDPFASSPPECGATTSKDGLSPTPEHDLPPPSFQQAPQESDDPVPIESDDDDVWLNLGRRTRQKSRSENDRRTKSTYEFPENTEDEMPDRSSPPSRKNTRPGKTRSTAISDESEVSDNLSRTRSKSKSVETAEKPVAQTRNLRRREQSVNNARNREESGSFAEPETTDEEMPQVPVGPRLAKLARRGLRSREVIGFIPSSSPAIEGPTPPVLPEPPVPPPQATNSTDGKAGSPIVGDDQDITPSMLDEFVTSTWTQIPKEDKSKSVAPDLSNHDNDLQVHKPAPILQKESLPGKEMPGTKAVVAKETHIPNVPDQTHHRQEPILAKSKPMLTSKDGPGRTPTVSEVVPSLGTDTPLGATTAPRNAQDSNTNKKQVVQMRDTGSVGPSLPSPPMLHKAPEKPRQLERQRSITKPTTTTTKASRVLSPPTVAPTAVVPPPAPVTNDRPTTTTAPPTIDVPDSARTHQVTKTGPINNILPVSKAASKGPPPPPPPVTNTAAVTNPTNHDDTGNPPRAAAAAPVPAPGAPIAPAKVKTIPNPATRGRKAALKSDAAGKTPQSILPPPEPVVMMMARPMPPVGAAANERPKRTMKFPGFTSAAKSGGGGPWSREAHDLLESGRPGSAA